MPPTTLDLYHALLRCFDDNLVKAGELPLHPAAARNKVEAARLLVPFTSDINSRTSRVRFYRYMAHTLTIIIVARMDRRLFTSQRRRTE